ncbi:MAG: hypothetical protein QGI93_00595 [Planctomycetota bacterium]|jgi:hypothetical protein|nr:hypothetical protein [Planctomycetota bacterium]
MFTRSFGILCVLGLTSGCASSPSHSPSHRHLGDAVLLAPARSAAPDPYYRVGPAPSADYRPFTKSMSVYGLDFIGSDEIRDGFMEKVADVVVEIFPRTPDMDGGLQRQLLQNLHRHRTTIPFFDGEPEMRPSDEAAWEKLAMENSICDIIMQDVDDQIMEVVEHILHHVSDVGLHYTFPDEWGLSRDSVLWAAMQEAIEAGYYDVAQYADMREAPEVYDRVLLQEFAYWIITCAWDLQAPYGPEESEWSGIRTPAELKAKLPRSMELIRGTLDRVMVPPQKATLEAFNS